MCQDLGARDLQSEVHVVCQVVRVGRMLVSESGKKVSSQLYRRPYAVAAVRVDMDTLRHGETEVGLGTHLLLVTPEVCWGTHLLLVTSGVG